MYFTGVSSEAAGRGKIRKTASLKEIFHTIIGLPTNLFYNTSDSNLYHCAEEAQRWQRYVLFIDASKKFDKGKQNEMTDVHINEVMETVQ